jgi:hypothetical protein
VRAICFLPVVNWRWTTFDNLFLKVNGSDFIVVILMNKHCGQAESIEHVYADTERFRREFQRSLRQYLARHGSVAEGFGLVWEFTLRDVPLEDSQQGQIYWELIQWARGYELFTISTHSQAGMASIQDRSQPGAR